MKKNLSRLLAGASLIALCLCLSTSAKACKSDYCSGSMAPTSLNQVSGGNPPSGNPPTAQQVQQCQNYAKDSETGSSLWAEMQSLPKQQQYAFYTSVMGTGGGENDLNAQVIANMFGGDMTAYNTWVNDNAYGTNGYVNNINFNPATGVLTQTPGGQVGQVPGWTCPYYP